MVRNAAPRGFGRHCHCCRQKRALSELIPCGVTQGDGGAKHGPWCHRCLLTKLHKTKVFVDAAAAAARQGGWRCPRCDDLCPCVKCIGRRAKDLPPTKPKQTPSRLSKGTPRGHSSGSGSPGVSSPASAGPCASPGSSSRRFCADLNLSCDEEEEAEDEEEDEAVESDHDMDLKKTGSADEEEAASPVSLSSHKRSLLRMSSDVTPLPLFHSKTALSPQTPGHRLNHGDETSGSHKYRGDPGLVKSNSRLKAVKTGNSHFTTAAVNDGGNALPALCSPSAARSTQPSATSECGYHLQAGLLPSPCKGKRSHLPHSPRPTLLLGSSAAASPPLKPMLAPSSSSLPSSLPAFPAWCPSPHSNTAAAPPPCPPFAHPLTLVSPSAVPLTPALHKEQSLPLPLHSSVLAASPSPRAQGGGALDSPVRVTRLPWTWDQSRSATSAGGWHSSGAIPLDSATAVGKPSFGGDYGFLRGPPPFASGGIRYASHVWGSEGGSAGLSQSLPSDSPIGRKRASPLDSPASLAARHVSRLSVQDSGTVDGDEVDVLNASPSGPNDAPKDSSDAPKRSNDPNAAPLGRKKPSGAGKRRNDGGRDTCDSGAAGGSNSGGAASDTSNEGEAKRDAAQSTGAAAALAAAASAAGAAAALAADFAGSASPASAAASATALSPPLAALQLRTDSSHWSPPPRLPPHLAVPPAALPATPTTPGTPGTPGGGGSGGGAGGRRRAGRKSGPPSRGDIALEEGGLGVALLKEGGNGGSGGSGSSTCLQLGSSPRATAGAGGMGEGGRCSIKSSGCGGCASPSTMSLWAAAKRAEKERLKGRAGGTMLGVQGEKQGGMMDTPPAGSSDEREVPLEKLKQLRTVADLKDEDMMDAVDVSSPQKRIRTSASHGFSGSMALQGEKGEGEEEADGKGGVSKMGVMKTQSEKGFSYVKGEDEEKGEAMEEEEAGDERSKVAESIHESSQINQSAAGSIHESSQINQSAAESIARSLNSWKFLVASMFVERDSSAEMQQMVVALLDVIPCAAAASALSEAAMRAAMLRVGLPGDHAADVIELSRDFCSKQWSSVGEISHVSKYTAEAHAAYCSEHMRNVGSKVACA